MSIEPRRDPEGGIVGVTSAAIDVTARKRTEDRLHMLAESLEDQVCERTAVARQRARKLRRLAAELGQAEQRERRRLSRLLHGDVQQLLSAIRWRVSELRNADGEGEGLSREIDEVDELVESCLETVRDLSHELDPPVLRSGSLTDICEWLAESFADRHGLDVTVDAPERSPVAPEHLRNFLFQALQELLFNVVKHSGSARARLELEAVRGGLEIRVEDGGESFDPEAVEARLAAQEGFGLFAIKERLEELGGHLEIEATSRGGGRFRLTVPLKADDASGPGSTDTRSRPA